MSLSEFDAFLTVRTTLAERVAAEKFARRGRRNLARQEDGAAMLAVAPADPDVPPLVYHLCYRDSEGVASERIVTLSRIELAEDDVRLWCYCHLRRGPRLFVAHHIDQVFDVTTGEVHEDPVTFFETHPLLTSPPDPEAMAIKICKHEINLLTVLGAADGLFDADEQDHLVIHIWDRCPELTLDEDRLRRRLALFAPTELTFRNSLEQIARFKRGDPTRLIRTMRKIIDADGRVHPNEMAFAAEVGRRLGAF